VYNEQTGEKRGCAATWDAAEAMIAAMDAAEHRKDAAEDGQEGERAARAESSPAEPAPAAAAQEPATDEIKEILVHAPEILPYDLKSTADPELAALIGRYRKSRHAADRCMRCGKPPTKAAVWAGSRALAWFCDAHYKAWLAEGASEIVAEHTLKEGEDPREWAAGRTAPQGHDKAANGPVEDGDTRVCVCPECGYTAPHKRGTPCTERVCPECSARLIGERSKALGGGIMEGFVSVWNRLGALLSGLVEKETWAAAEVNDLPDSSFLYVEEGGKKDDAGKTVPRSLRHLPYKDAGGKVDLPHLRNAISRLGQEGTGGGEDSWLTPALRARLLAQARRILEGQRGEEKSAMSSPSMILTFKDAKGEARWLMLTSTAFLDADEEIVSSAALEKNVQEQPTNRGPLRFWHVPGIDLGVCDFALYDQLCLIESGTWYDTPLARAAQKALEESPQRWGASIGFFPDPRHMLLDSVVSGRRVKAIYNALLQVVERSIVPQEWASNRYTVYVPGVEKEMDPKKRQALVDLVGEEQAAKAAAAVDGASQKGAEMGVFKGVEPSTLAAQLSTVAGAMTNAADAAALKKAADVLQALTPTPLQKATAVIAGMPDGEQKAALTAALAELSKQAKPEPPQGDEEEDEEEKKKKKAAEQSAGEGEVLALLQKAITDLATFSTRMTAMEKSMGDIQQGATRQALLRPTAAAANVDPNATAQSKALQVSKGAQTLGQIATAVFDLTPQEGNHGA
jgi:hypothetical protein